MKRAVAGVLVILMLVLFSVVLFRSAWLCDDAYITYRVVDNFVNGYGLRWNTVERVQVYTHPLWMFLNAALYLITREVFFTSIFLSLLISVCVLILYSKFVASSNYAAVIGIAILTFSKAFMDFSTSGLENPMTHLLLILFFIFYFNVKEETKKIFIVSLVAGLAAFNRMDTVLFYIPAIIYLIYTSRYKIKSIYISLSSFIPFILWELFSLFYYGFLFPNTAYAKLSTGIEETLLMQHGLLYYIKNFFFDPITLVNIAISIAVSFCKIRKGYLPIAIGMLLYLVYILRIGGDFMLGRYFSALLLLAVMIITHSSFTKFKMSWCFMLIFIIFLSLMTPYPTILTTSKYGVGRNFENISGKILDNRGYYNKSMGLLPVLGFGEVDIDKPEDVFKGIHYRSFSIQYAIGCKGFAIGPNNHILDVNALSDPLLARIPVIEKKDIWIGHFKRKIPIGYILTIKSGQNSIYVKQLAKYYDRISLITQGELFDINRIIEIFKMNLGSKKDLLEGAKRDRHLKAPPPIVKPKQPLLNPMKKLREKKEFILKEIKK